MKWRKRETHHRGGCSLKRMLVVGPYWSIGEGSLRFALALKTAHIFKSVKMCIESKFSRSLYRNDNYSVRSAI